MADWIRRQTFLGVLIGAALVIAGAGCGQSPKGEVAVKRTDPLRVVCTTGMVADIVRNLGGANVVVDQLMEADVDPHLYKPTPDDIRRLRSADMIVFSGLHLEGKMTELLEGFSKRVKVVSVGNGIDGKLLLKDKEGHVDPHIWLDVALWREGASSIFDHLRMHLGDSMELRANWKKYDAELTQLHEEVRTAMQQVPKDQRVLVTSHDAFRYFGRAYDVEVMGIQGISTETEASVRDIQNLVDFITKRKVKAVFVESSVNPRNMRALIEGCAQKGHEVRQGGELYSDAMGPTESSAGTYVGMIRHNVETLVKALK